MNELEKIISTEEWKNLIETYKPYIIRLGGSRAYQTNLEQSDYDLVMITKTAYSKRIINLPNINNKHCHVIIYSIAEHLKKMRTGEDVLLNKGLCHEKSFLGKILYQGDIDSLYNEYLLFLSRYKYDIVKYAIHNYMKPKIDLISFYGKYDSLEKVAKDYYYVMIAYDFIFQEDNHELIVAFRQKITTLEELKKIQNILQSMVQWYSTYNIAELEEFLTKAEELENKIRSSIKQEVS